MNSKNTLIVSKNPTPNSSLRKQLRHKISQFGDFEFEDDVWYCNRKHKDAKTKHYYTIRFSIINEKMRELCKYYALLKRHSVLSTSQKIYYLNIFFKYLDVHFPKVEFIYINRSILNRFEYFLKLQEDFSGGKKKDVYAAVHDFFNTLNEFPEFPEVIPTKNINPFKQVRNKQDRSIPPEVIRKWDLVMKNEEIIPLEFRTLYWLIRSFPNRITELLSINLNCLKSFHSEYTISIPTFKQVGGYDVSKTKTIPVIYTGHGKYVIDLLNKLQKQTRKLMNDYEFGHDEDKIKDYLFVAKRWTFFSNHTGLKIQNNNRYKYIYAWNGLKVNELFKQLSRALGIKDNKGNLYIPTSHQFRHNAVTDRLYVAGYTVEQLMKLTDHKNQSMPMEYSHQLKEKHKEALLNIANLKEPKESAVSFKGRILNLDQRTIEMLSKDTNRYLTWEVNEKKGVGICGDITGCNPKGTSVHFECYACDWFIPKADYYEDYKKEHGYWINMIERTGSDPKRAAHLENAIRNASYLERILSICEMGIEKYKQDKIQNKVKQHALTAHRWE